MWRSDFRPDEIIPLDDLIVLYDFTYTRHAHTFRCLQSDGKQILFQASDEKDLNLWMSTINYAATFRTADLPLLKSPTHASSEIDACAIDLPHLKERPEPQTKLSTATSIYAASVSSSELGTISPVTQAASHLSAAENDNTQTQDLMFPRSTRSDLTSASSLLPVSTLGFITRGDIERVSASASSYSCQMPDSLFAVQNHRSRSRHQARTDCSCNRNKACSQYCDPGSVQWAHSTSSTASSRDCGSKR